MRTSDDFSSYLGDGLQGTYDCVDRISLRGYFPMGQVSGGFSLGLLQRSASMPMECGERGAVV
jgi:hypothetical protein